MIALSDVNGTLELYTPAENEKRDHNATCVPQSDWTSVYVPCRRLDECLAEWKVDRIDLMKMDVEGGGATRDCWRCRIATVRCRPTFDR